VRESLAALLLKRGDAAGAVSIFREGLRRSPNDPRLLLGLSQAETATGRTADAQVAHKEFTVLWKGESEPNVADF